MRVIEILLLILAALYVAAAALYIYNTSSMIAGKAGARIASPNLANLPRNLTGGSLYLEYTVEGYVDMNGSIIDIDDANVSITVSYTEAPAINTTTNSTTAVNSTVKSYYRVSISGDAAILWALRQLMIKAYNASPSFSPLDGWIANSVSDIFGNLSLFTKTGEGVQQGSGLTYAEYSLNTGDGVVIVRISRDHGVPLECVINTSWGNLRFVLISAL